MLPILTCLLLAVSATDLLTVRGTVQDGAGQPVDRALVRILPIDSRSLVDGPAAISGLSQPDGSFELVLHEAPHLLRLDVRAPGFAPSLIDRIEPILGEIDVGPLLLLPGVTVTGSVNDPQGEPIFGARIFIRTAFHRGLKDPAYEPEAETDQLGQYRIDGLPAGEISVGVAAKGRLVAVAEGVDISDPGLCQIDFVLDPASLFHGSVTHAGRPVSDALVEVRRGFAPDVFFRRLVITDALGRFELSGLPENRDELVLKITAAGLDPTEFSAGSRPESGDYALESAPVVRIETAADGEAPAIDRIEFEVYTRTSDGWTRQDGLITEEDAQVLGPDVWLTQLPRGDSARFLVHSSEGSSARINDVRLEGPDLMAVAVFPARQSVSGRIVSPKGDGVSGQRVELGLPTVSSGSLRITRVTQSDSQGRFQLDDLNPGTYLVRESSQAGISEPVRFHLAPHQESGPIELEQVRPAVLQGQLQINGKPPETPVLIRAYRFLRPGRGGGEWCEVATVRTDTRGTYRLAPLLAGSVALVPIRPPEVADGSLRDRALERPPELDRRWPWLVQLEPGATVRLDFDVSFPERAWLAGTIQINEELRAGLPLTFRSLDGLHSESGRSGPSGHFRFRFEGGGRYELAVARGPLSTSFTLELEEGVDRLSRLKLEAGEVKGRIRQPKQPAQTQVRLDLQREPIDPNDRPWAEQALVEPDADGSFRFAEVLEGVGRVIALDRSKRLATVASDPFQITPGRTTEVPELSLPPASTLTAIMKGPLGEKLPFATLELRAAPGERELPEALVAWFVDDAATVDGLPPGKLIARVSPYGKWTASEEQTISMPADGSLVTVEFQITPQKP